MTSDPAPDLRELIVSANRILLHHGVLDGFGHVSARVPDRPDHFLLAKRMAPGLVGIGDIIEFGLDGEPVADRNAPTFLERYIHSAIYAARRDVMSIVHSHSPAMVTFSVVRGHSLRAICHLCGFIGEGAPSFEIRDRAGDGTNLLISNPGLGQALAATLGDAAVVVMRGHGFTTTGGSVEQAVYRAVYSEVNARIQGAALAIGPVTYLSAQEAEAAEATSELQVERTWAYWCDLVAVPR